MIKKVITSITILLAFVKFFLYFYKNSRQFQKSIKCALFAVFLLFSSQSKCQAKGVDGFTPDQQRIVPSRNLEGLFGTSNNNSPGYESGGGGDPNDNNPFSDSEINSDFKENRPESPNFDHRVYETTPDRNKNSKSDEEFECPIEGRKTAIATDGTFINISSSDVRDKGHILDFVDKNRLPKSFKPQKIQNLPYKEKLEFLRDRKNLPDAVVDDVRDRILEIMTAEDTIISPGWIGYEKIEGTLFVNLRTNTVVFRDYNGYRVRTALTMEDEDIMEIVNRNFHLFPNAGNPNRRNNP